MPCMQVSVLQNKIISEKAGNLKSLKSHCDVESQFSCVCVCLYVCVCVIYAYGAMLTGRCYHSSSAWLRAARMLFYLFICRLISKYCGAAEDVGLDIVLDYKQTRQN